MKKIALVLLAVASSAAFASGTYTPSTSTPRFTIIGPNTITFYEGQNVAALVKVDGSCFPHTRSKIEIVGGSLSKKHGTVHVDGRTCEVIFVNAFENK
jgi:hypothetical protein